jgi:NADPH:quinone reductase-like Zn-dependent oxidoreductase
MEGLFALYEAGKLRPTTPHVFALDDFPDAMAAVQERRGIGKVLLRMPRAQP